MIQKKLAELLNNKPVISYNSKDVSTTPNSESTNETEAIMWESDRNDPNRVKYRIHNLEQSFDTIRSAIFGYSISFRNYVTDDNGKLNEEKIHDFIEKLIDAYPKKDELSPEKLRFIGSFLYCAIVGPASGTHYETMVFDYCVIFSDSFSDLIRAAKDPGLYIKDPVRFASEEEQDSLFPEYAYGFLSSLNMVWYRLYEKTPDDYYTPEQKEAAAVIYEDITGYDYETERPLYEIEAEKNAADNSETDVLKINFTVDDTDPDTNDNSDSDDNPDTNDNSDSDNNPDSDNDPDTNDSPDTNDNSDSDDDQSVYDDAAEDLYDLPEPDYELLEAEKQATLEYFLQKWSEYEDRLPSDHNLGDTYKEFRDMLFTTEHTDLAQIITEMTESFLISEDLSPLCMGSEYGIIANTLEKSVRAISGKITAAEDLSKKRNNI